MTSDSHAIWQFFRFKNTNLRTAYTIPTTIVIGTACKKYPKVVADAISILNLLNMRGTLYDLPISL